MSHPSIHHSIQLLYNLLLLVCSDASPKMHRAQGTVVRGQDAPSRGFGLWEGPYAAE